MINTNVANNSYHAMCDGLCPYYMILQAKGHDENDGEYLL